MLSRQELGLRGFETVARRGLGARSVAFVLVLGSACTTDAVATTNPDGGPLDLGGGGPSVVDLTCPPLSMPAAEGTVFVDATASGGDGSRAAPFRTLAKALASAGPSGVIWLAAGTYRESVVIPDKDLVVYGGFAAGFGVSHGRRVRRSSRPRTLPRPVLVASAEVKSFGLDGLTVQKGARGLTVDGDSSVQATYTIANAVFAQNGQTEAKAAAPTFDRVNAKITRSVFRDNRASKGAAVASAGRRDRRDRREPHRSKHRLLRSRRRALPQPEAGTISRNMFRGNEIGKGVGYGWGGAVIVFKAGAAPVKTDFAYNVFTDNLAGVGGAVFVDDGATIDDVARPRLPEPLEPGERRRARRGALRRRPRRPGHRFDACRRSPHRRVQQRWTRTASRRR